MNAKNIDVEADLVESVVEATKKADPIDLVLGCLIKLDQAEKEKLKAEKVVEKAEEKCQEHLEQLYELTDEGDLQIRLPDGNWSVRKKRGRAVGYELKKLEYNKVLDLTQRSHKE